MATSNSSLNLVPLDFDLIKTQLKTYLSSQAQFLDYDFTSSNMNVLLDILSYNTFHNAFYLNMIASESYLDSAQLRNSVVSHAKELNYLPRSARSAKATININFTSNTNIVTIPLGTSFTSLVGSDLLTFVTDRQSVYFSSNGIFSITNLDIYEGKLTSEKYIVNYENTAQRYILSDPNIDTTSLSIQIIEDNTGNILTYTQATTTLDLNNTSKVFFIQAAEDGKYEIIFGDGIIGRAPKDGAIIIVQYRICSTTAGNGASKFTLDNEFAKFSTSPTVALVTASIGGAEAETINSIKFYAPRYFPTQERAINTNDYEVILKQKFPEISAISAYGGEEVSPPQFGKVFISVNISNVDGLPQSKIDEYYNYIKPRSPLSITPQFLEPEHLYYSVSSTVEYDISATSLTEEQIQSLVVNSIIAYNTSVLNNFKSSFRYSKFLYNIDSITNAGILSNDTTIKIYKKISPVIGVEGNIDLNFGIPLTTAGATLEEQYSASDLVAVESSPFVYKGDTVFLSDDNNGNMRLVKKSGTNKIVVLPFVGTVDYTTGTVKLISFRTDGYQLGENSIRVYAVTDSHDFETSKNVILDLESNQIDIKVIAVAKITQNV